MRLVIDLRRKRVKVNFEATHEGIGKIDVPDVEILTNKRQNKQMLAQIPNITAKLIHYLTMTNVSLLNSTYEAVEAKIREALESEKAG